MHFRWKTDGFEPSFVGTLYEKKTFGKMAKHTKNYIC
jgi:hypothetical protein